MVYVRILTKAQYRLVGRGTYEITTQWSYRTLMVIQYSLPAILLAGSIFFPESAYFLIKKGKIEAAEKALRRTHGSKDKQFLEIEFKRLTENVRVSEEIKKQAALGGPLIYQCFRGTNLVDRCLQTLMSEAYFNGHSADNCSPMDRSVLFRGL